MWLSMKSGSDYLINIGVNNKMGIENLWKCKDDYWKDKLLEKFEDGSFYTINLVHAKDEKFCRSPTKLLLIEDITHLPRLGHLARYTFAIHPENSNKILRMPVKIFKHQVGQTLEIYNRSTEYEFKLDFFRCDSCEDMEIIIKPLTVIALCLGYTCGGRELLGYFMI
jgi:hypothetical protein